MAKPINPFLVEGYISDEYFCDRENETETLITALRNGRNVTLISPRRMGKSGLIKHAFNRIEKSDSGAKCIYIDIFHTHSLQDFINEFATAIFSALDSNLTKALKNIMSVLKHTRPVVYADMLSGAPSMSLNIEPGQEKHTLRDIFEYLESSGKRIYIAFDEFQQIAEYPESGVEALLRSFIQFSPSINFIFAGSKKHLMQEMFTLPARPFYQSTQTLSLNPIPADPYFEFCKRHFAADGKTLTRDAFDEVYNTVLGHTWYVQYWMSRIYDAAPETIGIDYATKTLDNILREEDDNFYTYSQLVTKAQLKVLKGIAVEGEMRQPFSAERLGQLSMGAPSTVRSCIKVLLDRELLLEDQGAYTIYNRFFMLWLRQKS